MTNKTEAIQNAQEVVALLEREGNAKAANSVRAIIQERVYIDGLAKEYYDKLSEYVKHFDQKEQELRDRQAQLSAAPPPPERAPLTDEQIVQWWASENGLEDCDLAVREDFVLVVHAVQVKLGITTQDRSHQ